MAGLLENKIPLTEVLNFPDGPKKLEIMYELMPIFERFAVHVGAKSIGITFGPKDITMQDMLYFTVIQEAIKESNPDGKG